MVLEINIFTLVALNDILGLKGQPSQVVKGHPNVAIGHLKVAIGHQHSHQTSSIYNINK